MSEVVYIETSVVSYLVARPPVNTIAHQWKIWTVDWWRLRRPRFECVISPEVLREAAAGDSHASQQRMEALAEFAVLLPNPDVEGLVEAFMGPGLLPDKAKADAVHLAVATVYNVDYLITWNMKHLANAVLLARIKKVARKLGWQMPFVCTPIQLMGTIEYEG